MKLLLKLFAVVVIVVPHHGWTQKNIRISSPDGSIVYSFKLTGTKPTYSVAYKGKPLIASSQLSLNFDNGKFQNNLETVKPVFRNVNDTYELVVGKSKFVRCRYNEVKIPLRESVSPSRQINLVVRTFDDGLAFRYEFPQQANWKAHALLEENTTFSLTGDPKLLTLFLPSFTTSHEGEYTHLSWSEVRPDTLMDMPTLLEFSGSIFMAITEAALVNYAGMYLVKHNGTLSSRLSPLPGQVHTKVKASLPHQSPWRVLMISDRIGTLIESNILTHLNEPCKLRDVSWIKPGKTTFPWWNGNVTPDTNFAPGNNFETNKYYIDFCSRNGLEYHSVVEYGSHEWYVNDGAGFMPGPNVDVTEPVPGLDMQQICDYAKSVGVGIRVWTHWAALYPKLDSAFSQFQRWGIKGLMVDFMDRDDQVMVNIQEEILQKAANHQLHIQFHGAYKPTGLHRTYPNEFTREGTLNYESNKWDKRVNPDHDINIPFTRMLAGSTDYHLGGFRSVTDSQFKIQYTKPLMLGTRCHMLAMYVVLENYQGMICDYPAAYEGQPGFDFLQKVPTTWDDTKVLNAKVSEYLTVARKKNEEWFVGSISNNTARQLTITLDFLPEGNYIADIYTDAPDANENPNRLTKQTRTVNRQDKVSFQLASGGGAVIHFRKS